ncbi:acylphosphatase [Gracilibacillus salitolerans]|uniref:Acylphosphatase n=1 Tax=Gracilibacillus salitolerans TaxID=2663022 RepID=A0A5Q2TKR0_9BACI|nr:acylphosphatase [Gracilibacillus salitolerans]QGH34721.1 acylphosphatase [Gracilibacillus salitolerans]
MRQVHVIVSGRVQGVGFRSFTQQIAIQNDIVGWVKNLDDGSVEIEAQGEDNKVDTFLMQVKKGPSFFAKVKNIEITEEDVKTAFQKFEIKY